MPEWMLQKDNYIPEKDKDSFIDKSILSILKVLTKLRLQTDNKADKSGISAVFKLISVLLIIIFISLTRSFTFVIIANVFILVLINFLDIEEIKRIVKMGSVIAVFTLIILMPSAFLGYGNNIIMITLKVIASVTSVNILACTTQWTDLTGALKLFHVPDLFIFVLDITIKYIIVLGEFSLNMVYSLKLRSVGRSNNKSESLSGIMGTMFLKSKEMSEEMYGAMECRGFTGEYKVYRKLKFKMQDYICIIFDIIFILTYFYFDRL